MQMEIAAELLSQRMQEILVAREASWSKVFADAAKQVMRAFGLVERAALNVRDATKRAWGSLTRPMEQHGLRLSDQIVEICSSYATKEPGSSYDAVRGYEERSAQAARSITRIYNKYAGSIMRSAKSEVSVLQDSILSLNRSINELSRLLDESRVKEIKAAAPDADRIVQDLDRLRLLTEELAGQKDALEKLQAREPELQSELSVLSKDGELAELEQIEVRIKQKETEALASVESLSKPLRKIDRPDIKLPPELRAVVDKLVEDPLVALLECPPSDLLGVLGSLQQMIGRGDLALDDRRRRRAMRTIDELRTGGLARLREDYGVLQANRQEALRQLRTSGIYDRWSRLRSQINETETERASCLDRIADLESQETQQRSLIVAHKAATEKTLASLLEDEVSITIPF